MALAIRRNVLNVVRNFSEIEIKVRDATCNDSWGPSNALMAEIADLTYDHAALPEITKVIWKRLGDQGRNWRHVYKSLVLLEYLLKTGSEHLATYTTVKMPVLSALQHFYYVDKQGNDQGQNIRELSGQLIKLLEDEELYKIERERALKAKERFRSVRWSKKSLVRSLHNKRSQSAKLTKKNLPPKKNILETKSEAKQPSSSDVKTEESKTVEERKSEVESETSRKNLQKPVQSGHVVVDLSAAAKSLTESYEKASYRSLPNESQVPPKWDGLRRPAASNQAPSAWSESRNSDASNPVADELSARFRKAFECGGNVATAIIAPFVNFNANSHQVFAGDPFPPLEASQQAVPGQGGNAQFQNGGSCMENKRQSGIADSPQSDGSGNFFDCSSLPAPTSTAPADHSSPPSPPHIPSSVPSTCPVNLNILPADGSKNASLSTKYFFKSNDDPFKPMVIAKPIKAADVTSGTSRPPPPAVHQASTNPFVTMRPTNPFLNSTLTADGLAQQVPPTPDINWNAHPPLGFIDSQRAVHHNPFS